MTSHFPVDVRLLGGWTRVLATAEVSHDQITAWWARCLGDPDGDPDSVQPLARSSGPLSPEMGLRLTHELNLKAIEFGAGSLLMLHAGAIAATSGQVVGLVAESGGGKTTATVALARAGWGYVTDETLAVGEDGSVVAFPKPLAIAGDTDVKALRGPDELGLGHAPASLILARLVLLRRDPTWDGPPRLDPVPVLTALEALVGQSSALARLDRPLYRVARAVERCGGVWEVGYSDASELLAVLTDPLAHPGQPPAWDDRPLGDLDELPLLEPLVRDAVGSDEGVLLLVDRTPVRLSPIGALILREAAEGADPDQIAASVAGAFGDHPRLEVEIDRTLGVLRDVGALAPTVGEVA